MKEIYIGASLTFLVCDSVVKESKRKTKYTELQVMYRNSEGQGKPCIMKIMDYRNRDWRKNKIYPNVPVEFGINVFAGNSSLSVRVHSDRDYANCLMPSDISEDEHKLYFSPQSVIGREAIASLPAEVVDDDESSSENPYDHM